MDDEWDEDVDFTLEMSIKAFASIIREQLIATQVLQETKTPTTLSS
jgi:hypothetical protein